MRDRDESKDGEPRADAPTAGASTAEAPRAGERAHLARLSATVARGGVSRRKAQGAHYTPPALVDHLVAEALAGFRRTKTPVRVVDPACGSGNFLVAVARRLAARRGADIARVLEHSIHGIDIDAAALALAREALRALLPASINAQRRAAVARALDAHLVHGDALSERAWRGFGPDRFDLVLGNPPFLGQLKRGTASTRTRARNVSRTTAGAVKRYADTSAAFLLRGLDALGPRGRLGFVMPLSFLAAADVRSARDAALERAMLHAIWAAKEGLFEDANVRVCALVLEAGPGRSPPLPRRAFGLEFKPLPEVRGRALAPRPGDETWSPILADAFGAPSVALGADAGPAIGSIARATADFRDQYYGLRGALVEDRGSPAPLITTKHVDLGSNAWGACDVRVLGARMRHPGVDVRALSGAPKMLAWLRARRVPKILVATQTKVIEAWVDEDGDAVPLVPLITVTPMRRADLWRVAAAVASPVVAARAVALYAGSALSAAAIKLSARQLLEMPLPGDARQWTKSALELKRASLARTPAARERALRAFATASCRAHGLRGRELAEVLAFWESRMGF